MNKETYLNSLSTKSGKTQITILQLTQENQQLRERIDKAIEYINEEYYVLPHELTGLIDGDTLLKILKGKKENENK